MIYFIKRYKKYATKTRQTPKRQNCKKMEAPFSIL